tara:strand:- start:1873 stop:2043 length:171 start_codon:yes stop_codon:yes gene_type:complete
MIEEHNFKITKNNETRITEALESIADSLKTIKKVIASDPGDEVEHIYKSPSDYKMD